jgi:hypothetical protein
MATMITNPSILLNNQAILLFPDKEYGRAASGLITALKAAAIAIREIGQTAGFTKPMCGDATSQNRVVTLHFLSTPAELSSSTLQKHGQDITRKENPTGVHQVIIQEPIYFECPAVGLSLFTQRDYVLQTYGIMYNLALCLHLKASCNTAATNDQKDQNTKELRKALALYQQAQSLATISELGLGPLYHMSILSNIGHVHRCLGDDHQAQVCFQRLMSTIVFLVHHDRVDDETLSRLERFIFNTMPAISQESMISAPAA